MLVLGSWYYIADYVPMPGTAGFTPAFPDGTGFVLLAGPSSQPTWGIFACCAEVDSSESVEPVSTDVGSMIESGRQYPPALALARDDASAFPDHLQMNRREFADRYAERVAHHLSRQSQAPYVIAEAVVDEPGYLNSGRQYWILRYLRGAKEVRWVSDDFQVYQNPASDFQLTAKHLEELLMPFGKAV